MNPNSPVPAAVTRPQLGALRALILWQGIGVFVVMGIVALSGLGWWSAWMPALGFSVGTWAWGVRFGRRGALDDRAQVRALAWGSGWRAAASAALVFFLLQVGWPELTGAPLPIAALLSALLGGTGALVATTLALVGLDAARAGDPPQAAP